MRKIKYPHILTVRVDDDMKDTLTELGDIVGVDLSTFVRGQLDFSRWLWLARRKDSRFSSLWTEFTSENSPMSKIGGE